MFERFRNDETSTGTGRVLFAAMAAVLLFGLCFGQPFPNKPSAATAAEDAQQETSTDWPLDDSRVGNRPSFPKK